MFMMATVLRTDRQSLLVKDDEHGQEVKVFFDDPNQFADGDRIKISFNGQMTFSIPPQITATSIDRLPTPHPEPPPMPSELRAEIMKRGNNFLIVQDTRDRKQQYLVEYPYAHHFCIGQRVNIKHDTITLSNPPRVTATDITPLC